jgi:DNA-binding transcriptional LysR family regulator
LTNNFDKISIQKCILFHHLVKEGSPAIVGRKLKLPAFKIHNDLNSIEKSLGMPLVLRNQNRFILTEMGQSFAEFCRVIVENIGLIEPTSDLPKELTIATTHGLAETELPDILGEFYKVFPDVQLNIVSGPEYFDFTDASIDAVIGPHLTNRSDLSQIHLTTDPILLYAAPSYLEKYGSPNSIYDLRDHRLLSLTDFKLAPKEVFEAMDPFLTSNNLKSLYKMTLAGLGICALPKSRLQLDDILSRNIVNVLDNFVCAEVKAAFIHRRFSSRKILTDRLCEISKQYFKEKNR